MRLNAAPPLLGPAPVAKKNSKVESEGKLYSLPENVEMVFPTPTLTWWKVRSRAALPFIYSLGTKIAGKTQKTGCWLVEA